MDNKLERRKLLSIYDVGAPLGFRFVRREPKQPVLDDGKVWKMFKDIDPLVRKWTQATLQELSSKVFVDEVRGVLEKWGSTVWNGSGTDGIVYVGDDNLQGHWTKNLDYRDPEDSRLYLLRCAHCLEGPC